MHITGNGTRALAAPWEIGFTDWGWVYLRKQAAKARSRVAAQDQVDPDCLRLPGKFRDREKEIGIGSMVDDLWDTAHT